MFNNTKNIFLFILLAFVVTSCEDTESSEQDGHTDADGMEITTMLEDVETEMYSECLGSIDNEFANGVSAGSEWDFTVHFLDSNCEELEHDDEGHDDHDHGDDDHGDDDHSDEPYLVIVNGMLMIWHVRMLVMMTKITMIMKKNMVILLS